MIMCEEMTFVYEVLGSMGAGYSAESVWGNTIGVYPDLPELFTRDVKRVLCDEDSFDEDGLLIKEAYETLVRYLVTHEVITPKHCREIAFKYSEMKNDIK